MANPALMVLPLDGSLQGRDRSGVFSAIGAGAVRYRPASGARTNLWSNPSVEVDTSAWVVNVGISIARVADDRGIGSYCLEVVADTIGLGLTHNASRPRIAVGVTYTFSFWYWHVSGATDWRASGNCTTASGTSLGSQTAFPNTPFTPTATPQRFSISFTPSIAGTERLQIYLGRSSSAASTIRVDGFMLEEAVGDYFDGSTGGVWLDPVTGYVQAAHSSPSVSRVMAWLEDGRTNLVTNPWRASDNTGWSAVNGSTARSNLYAYEGAAAGLLSATAANAEERTSITAAASGHVAHAIVRNLHTASRQCQLVYNGSLIGSPVTVAAGKIATITATFTGTGSAANLGVRWLDSASGNQFVTYYLGAFAGSVADSPVPAINNSGTIQSGYAWSGTAHASTSTRTAATITMDDAGRIDPLAGSLAFRYVRDIDTGSAEPILDVGEGTTGKDRLRVRINSSDKLEVSWQSNGASETTLASTESIAVGTEYWVYVAWSGTSVWVGIDANALASGTRNAPQNNWGTTDLVVGTTAGSAGFGDLLIADRPLLPAERGAVRARSPISMGVLAGAPYKHFQLRPY